MSDSGDPDVTRLLRDLTRELQTLQREIDDESRGRMSTRKQLSQFTSEVAIPSIILLLETNIRGLKLLRRTIRLAEGREPASAGGRTADEVRTQAEQLGQQALSRLDETLERVQHSLEEEEADEDVRTLLDEARDLNRQISQQLAGEAPVDSEAERSSVEIDADERDPVNIDVDAELEALKDNLDDGDDEPGGDSTADGDDEPSDDGAP